MLVEVSEVHHDAVHVGHNIEAGVLRNACIDCIFFYNNYCDLSPFLKNSH